MAASGSPSNNPLTVTANSVQEIQEADEKKTIVVTAIGPDGQPMPGVFIHANVGAGAPNREDPRLSFNQDLFTDDQGRVKVDLPREFFLVRLWARADGYVPLFCNWENNDIANGDRPPAEFVFQMEKGIEIGGEVVTAKGEPVAGALVQVKSSANHPNGNRPGYVGLLAEEGELRTDEQGRWTLNNVPNTDDQEIEVLLEHPDYLRDEAWGEYQKRQGVTTAMFRDKSARIVMNQGVTVTGSIIAPDGTPIKDGLVVWGDQPYWEQGSQEIRIADGQFETPPLPPGEKRITVMAPGWGPQTHVVDIHPMMETVVFEMSPGKTLSVLVVDDENKPIPGAYVQIGKWRGVEAIYNHRHPNVLDSHIPILADQGGLYRWTWAPDDEFELSIGMPGYGYQSDIKVTAGDETLIVKLHRPSSISGVVVDKTTGQPIDGVSVIPIGVSPQDDGTERFRENRSDSVVASNGEFQISIAQFSGREKIYLLRLEIPGYAPLESDVFDETNVPINPRFELEPATWPTGRVVDAAGNPVKDAVIHLACGRLNLRIQSFISSDMASTYVTRSAEDGTFSIPPMTEPFTLIAGQKDGIAEIVYRPGDPLGDLRLRAWASVEGHVFDETGKPVSGLTIMADPIRYQYRHSSHIQDYHRAVTDNAGFYRFDQMPPMRYGIRTVSHTHEQMKNKMSIPVLAVPGETKTVDFGKGIPVRGQFKLGGSSIPVDYSMFHVQIVPIAPPPFGLPDELEALGAYEWRDGWAGYARIANDEDYQKGSPVLRSIPWHSIGINADGTFLMQLPQSGEYDLAISARGQHPDGSGVVAGLLGERVMRISVDTQANEEEPVDLGLIEIVANPRPQPGDELPNILLEATEGQTLELHSLRGKIVLLDFWCAWCEVCEADKAKLTELAEQLSRSDANTTRILSVEMPGSGPNTRAPVDNSGVWLGGRLPAVNHRQTLSALGIYSLPRYLIVEENGRLLYHGNLAGAIEILNK